MYRILALMTLCGLLGIGAVQPIFLAQAYADDPPAEQSKDLLAELKTYRHKIVYESNRDGNFELYLCNADGSNPVNLTNTKDVDEVYPRPSPDGTKICFVADEGKGDAKIRNVYYMNSDGTGRTKVADNGREPCWSPDGKQIAFLKGEFEKFTYTDFATKGLFIYDLKTGQTREHVNKKLLHLYTLNWTPDGNWFVATVHGGMGFSHAIVAIEANGDKVSISISAVAGRTSVPTARKSAGDTAIIVPASPISICPVRLPGRAKLSTLSRARSRSKRTISPGRRT